MKIKVLFLTLMIFLTIVNVNADDGQSLLQCSFKNSGLDCESNENLLFYANKNSLSGDGQNLVLNSEVSIKKDSNYNRAFCCRDLISNSNNLFSIENVQTNAEYDSAVMFFNFLSSGDESNARIGIKNLNELNNQDFNLNFYEKYLKLNSVVFENLDLKIISKAHEDEYQKRGYSCLFRISDIVNGKVSDCESTYNSNNKYKYIVYAKLIENLEHLKCTNKCTSVLDGRVYSQCSLKNDNCKIVPIECDGLIEGSWASYDNYREIKCGGDWNVFRHVNQEDLKVEASDGKCKNLISTKYPVVLNNEVVNMRIYVCGDN